MMLKTPNPIFAHEILFFIRITMKSAVSVRYPLDCFVGHRLTLSFLLLVNACTSIPRC